MGMDHGKATTYGLAPKWFCIVFFWCVLLFSFLFFFCSSFSFLLFLDEIHVFLFQAPGFGTPSRRDLADFDAVVQELRAAGTWPSDEEQAAEAAEVAYIQARANGRTTRKFSPGWGGFHVSHGQHMHRSHGVWRGYPFEIKQLSQKTGKKVARFLISTGGCGEESHSPTCLQKPRGCFFGPCL